MQFRTMDLDTWLLEYNKICKELGIDATMDEKARDVLESLVNGGKQPVDKLNDVIRGKKVVVFGAGPSLEKGIHESDLRGKVLIAADGATSALLKQNIAPNVIVTDLDGNVDDIIKANRSGAMIVVHAHGDNIEKLKRYVPKLLNVVASTQTKESEHVKNFFGFTDGDRAAFLAKYFDAASIEFVGFDFGSVVGKYSNPDKPYEHEASSLKAKKLQIAKRLIEKYF